MPSAAFRLSPTLPCRLSRGDAGAAAPQLPAADAFQACTSPARLANLTDGSYLFAGECLCLACVVLAISHSCLVSRIAGVHLLLALTMPISCCWLQASLLHIVALQYTLWTQWATRASLPPPTSPSTTRLPPSPPSSEFGGVGVWRVGF